MKGIKNLKVIKKNLLPLALASGMALSFTSCSGTADLSSLTATELINIENIKDITTMDELIADGQLNYGEKSIIQAVDQLERYMNTVESIQKIDFTDVDKLRSLSEDEYNFCKSLTLGEIEELKEMAQSKNTDLVSMENKLIALKRLKYIKDYYTEWIHSNGKKISLSFMMNAVKSSLADELNIPNDLYTNIIIPPAHRSASIGPENYAIEVVGKGYIVPTSSDEIWETINYIYNVQNSELTDETEFATYRKAINYGKTTLAAGCNIKNDKIEAQYDASYLEKNYKK